VRFFSREDNPLHLTVVVAAAPVHSGPVDLEDLNF
jgi:hypothetical protein